MLSHAQLASPETVPVLELRYSLPKHEIALSVKRTLNIPRLDDRRNSNLPRSFSVPVRIGKMHLVQIFLIFPEVGPVTGATATYLILMCSKIKGRVVIETTKERLYSE